MQFHVDAKIENKVWVQSVTLNRYIKEGNTQTLRTNFHVIGQKSKLIMPHKVLSLQKKYQKHYYQ